MTTEEEKILSIMREHGPMGMDDVVGFVSPVNFDVKATIRALLNRGELGLTLDWKVNVPAGPRKKDRRKGFGRRRVEKGEFCSECGRLK